MDDFNCTLEDTSTLNPLCDNATANPRNCPEQTDRIGYTWKETPPGTVFNQSCPSILGKFGPNDVMYRECFENGTWANVNSTNCYDVEHFQMLEFTNNLYVIGYAVSTVALVISLWIFFSFPSLRCIRIRIHTQLFISFVLNNLSWIIFYELVVPDFFVPVNNPVWCQVLHLLIQYFMLANYFWMFCEGLHLHLALVVVFVREEVTLKWFHAIGWGAPMVIVTVYALVTIYVTQDTSSCWMDAEDSSSRFILKIPVLISLLASVVFLVNVLRVILTIMHPNSQNPAPLGIRRAARATLILIPLFGLHFLLLPYRPPPHHPYEKLYNYVSALLISPQGFCVACLFCFANQDVHQAVKIGWHRMTHRNSRWAQYLYTRATDSAAVYVVDGNSQMQNANNLSIHRKSTVTVQL